MLGIASSAGSAGVESPDDADETSALIRSTGLLREPGDAVASGDEASDAAGDVSTSARVRFKFTESCICAICKHTNQVDDKRREWPSRAF